MDAEHDLAPPERVRRLLRHLGITRAHVVLGFDVGALPPEAVASLALLTPLGRLAAPLRAFVDGAALATPPLIVHGDGGPLAVGAPMVLAACPGATAVVLRDYQSALWSDVVAERGDEVGMALLAHLDAAERREPLPPVRPHDAEGEVAGIGYRAWGTGPPLLLFPLLLAPSQWEPIIAALAARYRTLALGGPHLGFVGQLEHRAAGGYGALADALIDAIAPPPGGTVLEVGCGAGPLARRIARRTDPSTTVVGLDTSPFMLREGAALARRAGLADRIAFEEGDAVALPFPDASFDAALACTVLEEVDADRALAELARVVRPGGRIAVAVRAIDLPFWDSLPLRPELRAKLTARPGAGVGPHGCADASLYRRFCALSLAELEMGPRLAIDRPAPATRDWRVAFEGSMLASVAPSEHGELRAAIAQAEAEGSYLWGETYHCAVGRKEFTSPPPLRRRPLSREEREGPHEARG